MKIAIVSEGYPSPNAKNAFAFVHARAKGYAKKHGVLAFSKGQEENEYSFENIKVHSGPMKNLRQAIETYDPDVLAIHAPNWQYHIPLTEEMPYPKVAWIHGFEALNPLFHHYYAFPLTSNWKDGIRDLKRQLNVQRQRIALRNFLARCSAVVFVSQWMKRTAERFLLHHYPSGHVIYNPVDTELFSYGQAQSFNRAVSIRPLEMKYGLDIAVKAYSRFPRSALTIYGKGMLEPFLRDLIHMSESNTKLVVESFEHSAMPSVLKQYDFFIAPSRTEAQGVTMCEAMSCGLPVAASDVGGIGEIVRNNVDGILYAPNTPSELRRAVETLIGSETKFMDMSRSAHERIDAICSLSKIIAQEIEILNSAAFGKKQSRERYSAIR